MQRTLKREFKELEAVEMEAIIDYCVNDHSCEFHFYLAWIIPLNESFTSRKITGNRTQMVLWLNLRSKGEIWFICWEFFKHENGNASGNTMVYWHQFGSVSKEIKDKLIEA
jgi:hypothetical protein